MNLRIGVFILPYKPTIKFASDTMKKNYEIIENAITKLHVNLNGTPFDATCKKVEELLEQAQRDFSNDSSITLSEQIEFYKSLRSKCVELGELRMFLIGYIKNKIAELQKQKEVQEVQQVQVVQEQSEVMQITEDRGRSLSLGNGQMAA